MESHTLMISTLRENSSAWSGMAISILSRTNSTSTCGSTPTDRALFSFRCTSFLNTKVKAASQSRSGVRSGSHSELFVGQARRLPATIENPDARHGGEPPGYSSVVPSRAKNKPQRIRKECASIEIRGAWQNNLKGIDLDLPLGQLTVITGPSGSGKSSLAFDTIYAEGQRRYVETFSPYMRQFLDRMDKPRVDDIRGIPPAIAIEQSNPVKTSRSTVGTMTEINDYLKLLWPLVACAFCPSCGRKIRPETAQSVAEQILHNCAGKNILITFWVAVPSKTEPRIFFDFLQQQGYLRVWLEDEIVRVDTDPKIKRLG